MSNTRTLHSKRSFGTTGRLGGSGSSRLNHGHHTHHALDSPAYDASEEDNDYPLTDDSIGRNTHTNNLQAQQRAPRRNNVLPGSSGTTAGTGPTVASGGTTLSSTLNTSNTRPALQSTSSTGGSTSASTATTHPSRPHSKLVSSIVLSDSEGGTDSPTYDGDVESSATTTRSVIDREHHHPRESSTHSHHSHHSHHLQSHSRERSLHHLYQQPILNSSNSTMSIGKRSRSSERGEAKEQIRQTQEEEGKHALHSPRSSPRSSNLNSPITLPYALTEPAVPAISASTFNPAALTTEDIQAFVRKAIEEGPDGEVDLGFGELEKAAERNDRKKRGYRINEPPTDRAVRIYADGVYDLFHFGHALQLRQAKLSFPNVYLLVGVNSDEQVHTHKARTVMTHAERLEAVRHCRWVDEVVSSAPWVIDQSFLDDYQIDYVAHDEEAYQSAGHDDVYGFVKSLGKFIPTRRTPGVSTSDLLGRIVQGYRSRDFDEKLRKMGREELRAEGSDYDDLSRVVSRVQSRRASIGAREEVEEREKVKKVEG